MTPQKPLRTLKDLEHIGVVEIESWDDKRRITNYKTGFQLTDELRAEARKWIKELEKQYNFGDEICWIKHFFNLENK